MFPGAVCVLIVFILTWWWLGKAHTCTGRWDQTQWLRQTSLSWWERWPVPRCSVERVGWGGVGGGDRQKLHFLLKGNFYPVNHITADFIMQRNTNTWPFDISTFHQVTESISSQTLNKNMNCFAAFPGHADLILFYHILISDLINWRNECSLSRSTVNSLH